MNLSRSSLIFCLTSSILMSSAMHAADTSRVYTYTKYAALGTLALMLAKFFSTEPNSEPVRYDLDAAQAQLKALLKGENTQENLSELATFTWYFIIDGIIGHASKRPSLRVDPETMKVDARPGAYAKGLFGNIHDYAKAPLGICYLLVALNKLVTELPVAWKALGEIYDNPSDAVDTIGAVKLK